MQLKPLRQKLATLAVLFTLLLNVASVTNAFAQQRIAKNDIKSFKVDSKMGVTIGNEVSISSVSNTAPQTSKKVSVNRYDDVEDYETMWTTYDLQSNKWVSNRMYQMPNGSVGVVATFSHEFSYMPDRGTGYNFYNGTEWQDMPEYRVESVRTGWPTIAQWGDNGEILISHSPLRYWTREVAGQGEWEYRGELPIHPDDYPYTDDALWPRVATSGDHHNIIHVIADIQHAGNVTENHQVYYRSTDAENWTCTYSPLAQDGEETGHYSADSYNITANGHNVAILYGDNLQSHVVMYKSTNDGQTWNRTVIWQNPYYGYDWETDPNSIYTDTVYGPANLAIAIDNNGVAHVAMSTYEYIHSELGSNYTTFSGRTVDGIYYWNDTQTAPIQSENGNPHDALRLWWPDEENPGYLMMHNDSTKWIGYDPIYDGFSVDNDKYYYGEDYSNKIHHGLSAWPALSIDPMGNIACAYSAPNITREDANTGYYLRSIYVSYRNVNEDYWHQAEDDITDPEMNFTNLVSENVFTYSVDNTTIPGEFWFSFQSDDRIGLYCGNGTNQNSASENRIQVVKVVHNPFICRISVTANPTSGGTLSGGGSYLQGDTCTLTAMPNEEYAFVNWTENGEEVSTDASYSFIVTSNRDLVANFVFLGYHITALVNPEAGGTVNGMGYYLEGETCTLTATPNDGYFFENWTENGQEVSTEATYSFTVMGNRTLIANFVDPIGMVQANYYPDAINPGSPYVMVNWCNTNPFEAMIGDEISSINEPYMPFYTYYNYSISEALFTAAELAEAGVTTAPMLSLSWEAVDVTTDQTQNNISIWMANVPDTELTATSHLASNMTLVYTGNIGIPLLGWNEFVFNENIFSWDGHSNVLILCQRNNGQWNGIVRWRSHTPGFYGMTYKYQDNTPYDAMTNTYAMTCSNTSRPNTLFKSSTGSENNIYYKVYRTDCDSNSFSLIAENVTAPYVDSSWLQLPIGTYQYGVSVVDSDGNEGEIVTSNCIDRNYYSYQIVATPYLEGRGTVSGAGEYALGATCTLTATPIGNNTFTCWKENGTIVSTDANYSFIVIGPRSLVAVFSVSPEDYIVFADNNVKALCVSNWDIDGDGELAYDEAAIVTDLGSVFQNHSEITSFDELQYFTGLTSVGYYAFYECSSLASIVIPEGVSVIGSYAFYDCYNLISLNIPEGIVSIGEYAFYVCGLLIELTLPEPLEYVGEYAFFGCDGITTVNYNAINCQTMGSAAKPVFYDCAFTHLYIGENVQSIPNFAFKRCFMITDMTVAAVNPPTIYPGTFGMVSRSIPVSVPYGSGDIYINAQYWEEFFNIIEIYFNDVQTVQFIPGTNWFSTYLDITLDDLKAALVAAMPNNNSTITIKSKTQNVKYQNGRWAGQLTVLDVAQMYKITVPEACEISLVGVLVDPSTLTFTLTPGANWIAFPYNESMSVTEFCGSFPVNNDVVKSKLQNTRYYNGRWAGQLNTLIPGQGYIYKSAATGNRTFTFPTSAK